jgi:methionine synthase II (cobalamin-independent)
VGASPSDQRMTIRTTCVGSWPIPFGLRLALKSYYAGTFTDGEADGLLSRAARIAMDEMIACGVEQIMGGEVWGPDFVHHVPPRLAGLETMQRRDPAKGYQGIGRYRIIGDVSAPIGTGHALGFRRERKIEPRLDKGAVPSPRTMTLGLETDPRIEEQLPNYIRIVKAEVEDMVKAGASEIQLDAPAEAMALANGTHQADQLVDSLTSPFDGVSGITRTVHFCLGDISRKAGTEVQNLVSLMPLFQALDGFIDRAHIECSHAGQWSDRALLAEIPPSIEIVAGIADVKREPQSVSELSDRIAALLDVVDEDRLLLSTSCGCGRVPHDEAIRLLRNLVKAAGGE